MRFSLLLLLPTVALGQPAFERVNPDIDHIYAGGWEHFVGGGVAVFDCDGDALPELYVAGGENPAALFQNRSGEHVNFVENTPKALALTAVTGAYPLDIDSDGWLDLFVMRVGENQLLQGGPDCSFAPFSDVEFTDVPEWTTAFSATWEKGRDMPTLAIGNYVDREDPDGPFETCDANYLYRPDAYNTPLPLEPGYCTLSMLFTDWGHTGTTDLRISNDRHYYVRGGSEQMWAMSEVPHLYGETDGWHDYSIWGMGIASEDITGDGVPEVFLSSMGDQKLQMLDTSANGPTYLDATYERGTTAHRPYIGDDGRPSTGWHISFGDVDNDGLSDVFVAKGNVEMMPVAAMEDPNNLLMQQADGTFVEMGDVAGIASLERGRGAGLVDFNLDGLLDLVVVNRRAPMEIYQNITQTDGNWLLIALRQTGSNTRAVGAWIEVETPTRTFYREITVGGGHASGASGFQHFGLGLDDVARVRVNWPSGEMSDWMAIDTNSIVTLSRDAEQVVLSYY